MSVFRVRYPVRFADCDPAGIAYYPKLFELADAVIEDWTAEILCVPRSVLHLERELGLPTVDLRANFVAPLRLGDEIDFALAVRKLGASSIDFALEAAVASEARFSVRYTQVLFDMKRAAAEPWPAEWRARIEKTVTGEEDR